MSNHYINIFKYEKYVVVACMSQRLSFTVTLSHFLIQEGYTHIHYRGIEKLTEAATLLLMDNYIRVPLKNCY